jgi:hypothetical protein
MKDPQHIVLTQGRTCLQTHILYYIAARVYNKLNSIKIYIFKCQVSLLIRELHIKITVRYYFLPGRIAVVKKKREDINAAIVENVEVP